jgi:hypothetical protein
LPGGIGRRARGGSACVTGVVRDHLEASRRPAVAAFKEPAPFAAALFLPRRDAVTL